MYQWRVHEFLRGWGQIFEFRKSIKISHLIPKTWAYYRAKFVSEIIFLPQQLNERLTPAHL